MRNLVILGVVGLIAQLVDGSLGMGFGVTSSTLLIAAGIAPAMASASIHFAEVGTTLISGVSHHQMGNVDWRTVGILAVPGGVGAFFGAHFLVSLPAEVAKPWVGGLLFCLGLYVIWRFLVLGGRRPSFTGKLSAAFLMPVGLVGGTLDAIGGGGWGPVGTTSLLSSGRLSPRKVIGSVSASEFVVAVGGSLGFLMALGSAGINIGFVAALLAGGMVAAPLAAWLVKHLRARVLGVAAGGLILVTNSQTVLESLGAPGTVIAMTALVLAMVWVALIGWAVVQERRADTPDEELATTG
ncbi:MAG: sulfite exporter TauE/SafE family protein [Nocardioidaceae bacterium]|jgi:uncharacterized membrane protein YfcA|nr:sulfite exporter TauE/SafE family protein [Nocardioidaceae bacterium]